MTHFYVILVYKSRNVDAPEDRATENYNYDRIFRGNSPNLYANDIVQGIYFNSNDFLDGKKIPKFGK